jgi:hypothetical protein
MTLLDNRLDQRYCFDPPTLSSVADNAKESNGILPPITRSSDLSRLAVDVPITRDLSRLPRRAAGRAADQW